MVQQKAQKSWPGLFSGVSQVTPVCGFGGHALVQQGSQISLPLETVIHAVDHDAVGVGGLLGDHGGQGGDLCLGDGAVAAGLCQRFLKCPDLPGQEERNVVRRLLGDLLGEGGFHRGPRYGVARTPPRQRPGRIPLRWPPDFDYGNHRTRNRK